MKKKINEIIKKIEKEEKVKVLFCVENGSRAWDMASEDSDYDVRFVFTRLLDDYLQINKKGEVIKHSYDKEGNKSSPEGCFIDVVGFDIFKFTKMLWSSNPTVVEWLTSDIVYYGKKPKVFIDFVHQKFNPKSLYYHYRNMCESNYKKYIKG